MWNHSTYILSLQDVFGFDERAVQVLLSMEPKKEKEKIKDKFAILLDRNDDVTDLDSEASEDGKKRVSETPAEMIGREGEAPHWLFLLSN